MSAAPRLVVSTPFFLCLLAQLGGAQLVAPVSLDAAGVARGGFYPAMSADGRYVAFVSPADDLVPNDTNAFSDVFLRDRVLGTIERVSVASDGSQTLPGGFGSNPFAIAISDDGRFVLFSSEAPNLVPADTNNTFDCFVRDRQAGTTECVSVSTAGVPSTTCFQGSFPAAMSADGRFVLMTSGCADLDPSDANGGQIDVFLRDRQLRTTQIVSRDSNGIQSDRASVAEGLSADGSRIVFWSIASNLVAGDTNGIPNIYAGADLFLRDVTLGTTVRVSVASGGVQSNGPSSVAAISGDGTRVAFLSEATNLVPGDTDARIDVFVHHVAAGVTERVNVSTEGAEANGTTFGSFVEAVELSRDGRWVAFPSEATNLAPGDTNGAYDVFTHDLATHTTSRVSPAQGLTQIPSGSTDATISADGRFVAYSVITDHDAADTNMVADVYLLDRGPVGPHHVFCEGSTAACPCGNGSDGYAGCKNSFGTSGLHAATGDSSVSADTIALVASGLPPTATALFFQGTTRLALGAGVPFGDGLRCVGGSSVRLATKTSSAGECSFGHGVAGDPPVSVRGGIPPAGGTRHYQVWYRNVAPFCTSEGFNLTNGLTLGWRP